MNIVRNAWGMKKCVQISYTGTKVWLKICGKVLFGSFVLVYGTYHTSSHKHLAHNHSQGTRNDLPNNRKKQLHDTSSHIHTGLTDKDHHQWNLEYNRYMAHVTGGPFNQHVLTGILAWISNHINFKECDVIILLISKLERCSHWRFGMDK